jgi:homogentisate 1,2-dioxygenase
MDAHPGCDDPVASHDTNGATHHKTAREETMTGNTLYMSGFGNGFESEALPGALRLFRAKEAGAGLGLRKFILYQ